MIETSRSLSYLAFATAFTYPDQEVLQAIRGGELAGALQRLLGAVDPALVADVDWKALGSAVPDDDTLLVEFDDVFGVGGGEIGSFVGWRVESEFAAVGSCRPGRRSKAGW